MTMRLDIVTNDAGELVRREYARELGATVTVSIYRLSKLAQMHDLSNQAFLRQLEQTHQGIQDYCLRAGMNVNILFAQRAIFVAGQLLKGNRAVYDQATELGEIFEWLGGSDFTIMRDVTMEELRAFAESISVAMRSQRGAWQSPSPKIRLRHVADAARLRGLELENLTFDQRIVRTYASAVVILRRFFEDLQASRYILPRRIKRVAQSLVDLSGGNTPAFLGVTEVRNQNHDDAGRAVNTAILAVAMAREITDDRQLLAQIAMAAMMHDVGRPRAAALGMGGQPPMGMVPMTATLSEDQEDRLAAGTAAVLTALGRVNEPSITRTVVAFESLWLRRQRWIGPLYRGVRPPTLHAKMIQLARRYNDLLTPEPGLPPPTPDFAVATLSEELKEPSDKTILRMLVAALGLVPVGTVVQLSTGEIAEVVRGGIALDRPRVRIVMDSQGGMLPAPRDVDLAQPDPNDPPRKIIRVMNVDGWRKGLDKGSAEPDLPPTSQSAMRAAQEISARPASATGSGVVDAYRPKTQSRPSGAEQSGRSDSNSNVSSVSQASFPSLGSSPSAVAEAMGRMINDALYPDNVVPTGAKQTGTFESGRGRPTRPPPTQEPTARGTLAATPLAHVLVYMLDHSLTGAVVFYEQDGYEHDIYFMHGIPAKVRLGRTMALLGEELIIMGAMERGVLDNAVESSRRLGVLLGEFLVGENLVSRDVLARALEAQLLKKVAALANLPPETSYAYYRDVNTIAEWGGREITLGGPLNPILATVRAWHDRARVRATLSRVGKHPLVFHEEADLASLLLTPQEKVVIDTIRNESSSLPQLYKKKLSDDEVVSSLVYTLAVTRQFAFKGQKKGPMATRSALPPTALVASSPPASNRQPAGPPPGATTTQPIAVQSLPEPPPAAARPISAPPPRTPSAPVSQRSPLPPPVSQVPRPGSAPAAAGTNPPAPRPTVPPQNTPRPPLQPLSRPAIRPIGGGAKISGTALAPSANGSRPSVAPTSSGRVPVAPAAKSVPRIQPRTAPPSVPAPSTDPQGEVSIDVEISGENNPGIDPNPSTESNPPTQAAALAPEFEEAEKALEAMTNFRLAETALQRGDIPGAELLARKAVDGDPDQSEYRVLHAWIRAMGADPTAVDEAIGVMTSVLNDDSSNERALLYRGKLYKRANKLKEAQRDFNALLASNPQHREAASEVRLLKLRK